MTQHLATWQSVFGFQTCSQQLLFMEPTFGNVAIHHFGPHKIDTCSSLSSFSGSTFGNGVSMVLARKDWLYCEHQLLQLETGRSLFRVPGGVFSPTFRRIGVFGRSKPWDQFYKTVWQLHSEICRAKRSLNIQVEVKWSANMTFTQVTLYDRK